MAVDATLNSILTTQETLASGVDGASSPTIVYDSFNDSRRLNATSTTPATKVVSRVIALSGGAYTIDLTTITGANGLAQDGTGLKVQVVRIKNLGAAGMTFTVGASNGYNLLGASMNFTLLANQRATFDLYDASPDIASGDRTIDVAGTAAQTFELDLLMG
jgi:hypothetical protein